MIDTSKKTTGKRPAPIDESPIVIGCIGGSGSRLVSQLVMMQDYYFGHCKNKAQDNLWFSFLFRRLAALKAPYDEFQILMDIFVKKMNNSTLNNDEIKLINQIAQETHTLPKHVVTRSLSSLIDNNANDIKCNKWGWKEPNSHLFVPEIYKYFPQSKYIYIIRHPLDMAFSDNQNQLKFWGKHFLGENCKIKPYYSLKFWLLMYSKIKKQQNKDHKLYILNYDSLVQSPVETLKQLYDFMGYHVSNKTIQNLTKLIKPPKSIGRFKMHSLELFDEKDLELINKLKLFEQIKF